MFLCGSKKYNMEEQDFIKAGFTVIGTENKENKLLSFLKENYPNVIRDTEINLEELKAVLGLPIDEKVNGYGLNFVGRNFARAKYSQKTEKELRLNTTLSKNIDTTQNLVLKGDNLDCLKILKNHYSGKIKFIYIDPPYNTANDEFVYPDKFDKEEAEVLGLANLSESDFARMDFSFKTKKSHNGWLAFMYPRLLLARDLLSKDGVIFISIDDNEQANLKLLCDDVFGEENFVNQIAVKSSETSGVKMSHTEDKLPKIKEYLLAYSKNNVTFNAIKVSKIDDEEKFKNYTKYYSKIITNKEESPENWNIISVNEYISNNGLNIISDEDILKFKLENSERIIYRTNNSALSDLKFKTKTAKVISAKGLEYIWWERKQMLFLSDYIEESLCDLWTDISTINLNKEMAGIPAFFKNGQKPLELVKRCVNLICNSNDIILDFFAGSGTTGHAVMQLNAEDGGSRKFILCQIDEPIKEDKPAYKFCIDNNLPPVISSITIERLKRAGEKIAKDIEAENSKSGMFEDDKKQVPDIGFKVFDSVEAPKLKVDDKGQISITENETDALSRIYNMIFTVGLDEPTQVPEEVVKDCIYKIGNHYYITNSGKISKDDFSTAIKNGKVFIDGWTASLNGTLQNYKEDVKIVF
jgi:adenine-specific DNA-methyltransferase